MSYEGHVLDRFAMPSRGEVEQALLQELLRHGGAVKEFASGQQVVDELANQFRLSEEQRSAALETVYRREGRPKRSLLWHRLLFRSADSLAKRGLVSRPTQTWRTSGKREWMLTERGLDEAISLSNIPASRKNFLLTKSFEVQRVVRRLVEAPRPENYNPVDSGKRIAKSATERVFRSRAFRQAVIEAYGYRCAICGLKIQTPDSLSWEVEAAHIVPACFFGRDDVCNGIAMCRLHHWAFDAGWFTVSDDYAVLVSSAASRLPKDWGKIHGSEFLRALTQKRLEMRLPLREAIQPHRNATRWHRQNIFHE